MAVSLPPTHKALVLKSTRSPLDIVLDSSVPVPQPTGGSAVVQVLAAPVVSYLREVYSGVRRYNYPEPMVIGASAIGRVAAVGSDATLLQPGQLVLVDSFIRGRDDESKLVIGRMEGGSAMNLMEGEWRDGTFAEYHKAPLENIHVLDEKRLMGKKEDGGLGLVVEDFAYLNKLAVAHGGFRSVGLQVGETVLVAPATGGFSSAAVRLALNLGAGKVIMVGRDASKLGELESLLGHDPRLNRVVITGDVDADTRSIREHGPVSLYFDMTPDAGAKGTHLKSAFQSLRHGARVCLMGGWNANLEVPLNVVIRQNIRIHGVWMYTRDDLKDLIHLVNVGVVKLGEQAGVTAKSFHLEDFYEAFDFASEQSGPNTSVVIAP